ncbi:3-hydroxybutyrate dehydrogenase [Prauserella sp. PE36]|uniref:SDR family oxidoreductase n=1 Tax=Prauserella endophytica TaxID=1592324 RepID=A0ABY2S6S8_9PSEU|nr:MULTISPECIES: 3-hydroxybutyrate dehydrogenase [Prauserella]PXY26180.1 3-hydroxybutyrate dehydrogenase [Prauserella coralliicola]RBM19996.1 3-hydroxybutyrate dehydrogenase [Prauserella sp. PE36]TKG71403.1 SDR family oxidoreductase [Prauserella endophytica]
MTSTSLHGRTALVTGGASGIGRACVQALSEAGAKVHLVDADADGASATAEETGAVAHVADLTDPAAVAGLPAEVDVLVNNAGFQHIAAIPDFPPEKFSAMQQLMVTTPFLLMRHCLPAMYERGWGRLINISSVHGVRASPNKAAYVAAKHGLEGLSKVAALEGAAHGVTSNCVDPGYVRTALVEGQVADQARSRGIPERAVVDEVFLGRTAVKRLIEPAEVAAVVLWLCGEQAGYLTGASIPLDGGWTAS